MNKDIVLTSMVAAGANDNPEYPIAIANGKTWMIKSFGAADVNFGDNRSSVYILRFGTEILRIVSLTGATQQIEINKEITGDGTKKINVQRYNLSGTAKQLPCWIMAHERLS